MSTSIGKGRLKLTTNLTPVKIGRPGAITGANSSLFLDFLSGSLDASIDFTRTSAATYVANTGFVTQTPASRNLLTYTQEFDNVAWTKNATTVTANSTAAPDGTMTADTLVASAGAAVHNCQQTAGGSGTPLAMSVYVKAGTHSFVQFWHGASVQMYANFNVSAGTVGTVGSSATASITSVGNGWYRCTMVFTPSASGTIRIALITSGTAAYNESWTAAGTETVFIWGAQLEAVPDANLVLGSELGTNGDFSGGTTGWLVGAGSLTVVGGRGRFENTSATASYAVLTIPTVAGRAYRLNMEAFAGTTFGNYRVGTTSNGTELISTVSVSGNVPRTFVATTTTTYVTIRTGSAVSGEYCEFDNISVKEITGTTGMPTTYTRNVGGVYPPRFDYDPVTLAPRGLLIEEQRTNLLLRSEEFDNAAWVKTNATITANAVVSPDGTADADKLVETTGTGSHRVNPTGAISLTSGTTYTATVYAKSGERTRCAIITYTGATDITSVFDLSAGSVVSGPGAITAVGGGWYRLSQTYTAAATLATIYAFQVALNDGSSNSYTGDGTSGIYLWGAQLEAGAFATSYIPTVASQVTRTRDEAAIQGPNFASWYNGVEGTLLIEGSVLSTAGGGQCPTAGFDDGTASNRYIFFKGTGTTALTAYVSATGATGSLMTLTANTPFKAALAFNSTGIAACANGGSVSTASGTATGINRLSMGQNIGGISVLPGHVRRIRYYPTRLSNTQLQALTA